MNIKISSRYRAPIFAFVMSFNTALLVSGVITFLNTPSTNIFLQKWPANFILGWPLVFISILFIAPQVNRLVDVIVE
jgi:hypothetical protein